MENGYISTDEEAIAVLKKILERSHVRGNGKSIMATNIDLALIRAIAALEKKIQEESDGRSNNSMQE
jgi:hypothetical protein